MPSLEPEIPADDSLPPFPPNSSPDGGGDDDDDDDDDDDESPADDKWPPSPPKFSPDVLPCDWIMIVVFSDDPTPSTVIFPFSDLSANTFERAFQVPATGSARTSNPSEDSLNFGQRHHRMQSALAYLSRPICRSTNDSPIQTPLNNNPRINVVCISNALFPPLLFHFSCQSSMLTIDYYPTRTLS